MSKDLPPSRTADQFVVRFPDGMRDQIAEAAKANNRSMNAEIVARLHASLTSEMSLVGALPAFQMSMEMGPAEGPALTPEQLKIATAIATEAVRQVVLRADGTLPGFEPPPGHQVSTTDPFARIGEKPRSAKKIAVTRRK